MLKIIKIILLPIIANIISSTALADVDFKDLVFNNCKKARELFDNSPSQIKVEHIKYLGKVLSFSLNDLSFACQPEVTTSSGSAPGIVCHDPVIAPIDDFNAMNLWRTFQPLREVSAKRCAIDILNSNIQIAVPVFVDVINSIDDPNLPEDLRPSIQKLIWEIVLTNKANASSWKNEELFIALINKLDKTKNSTAQHILVELYNYSIPYLINSLNDSNRDKRTKILSVLKFIDGEGSIISKPLLEAFLESNDYDLKSLIINTILAYPKSFHVFFNPLLSSLNSSPESTKMVFINAIIAMLASSEAATLTIKKEELPNILLIAENTNDNILLPTLAKLGLLLQRSKITSSEITALIKSKDEKTRIIGTTLLGYVGDLSPEAQSQHLELLYDSSISVRACTFDALSLYQGNKASLSLGLQKFLKSNSRESHHRDIYYYSVSQLALKKNLKSDFPIIAKYLVNILGKNISQASCLGIAPTREQQMSPIYELIANAEDRFYSQVIKLLKSSSSIIKYDALQILTKIIEKNPSKLPHLIQYFIEATKEDSKQIKLYALNYLLSLSSEKLTAISKILNKTKFSGNILVVIYPMLLQTKEETHYKESILKLSLLSCEEIREIAPFISNTPTSFQEMLKNKLLVCFAENPDISYVKALTEKSLNLLTTRDYENIYAGMEKSLDKDFINQVFGVFSATFNKLENLPDDYLNLLLKLIKNKNIHIATRAVKEIITLNKRANKIEKDLQDYYHTISSDNSLKPALLISLISINQLTLENRKYYHNLSNKISDINELLNWTKMLNASLVLQILEDEIKAATSEKLLLLLPVFEYYGEAALGYAELIGQYVKSNNSELKVQALITLINISPHNIGLAPQLLKELKGDSYLRILSSSYPTSALGLINEAKLMSNSYYEHRCLEILSARLSDNK